MHRDNSATNKPKSKPKLSPLTITKAISHKAQGVTSLPATLDNDQEWNIVDNHKRIRSPNNYLASSKKTK